MKALLAAALCLCLLALCACGEVVVIEETTATTTQAPTTTLAPTTLPIEYPASYRDAPEAYKPILDDLFKSIYILSNNILDAEDDLWGETGISDPPGFMFYRDGEFRDKYMGYAIKDINKDGVPELLIMTSDSSKSRILSLFTLKDDVPVHLDSYWNRHYGHLAADGTIYTSSYGGIMSIGLCSYKLESGATELTQLTKHHSGFIDGKDVYLRGDFSYGESRQATIYDEQQVISEKDFKKVESKHNNPPNPMPLTFIPIEQ